MSKIFYDHLLPLSELLAELDKYALESEEKTELVDLIDQHFHHHTLNVILNLLPDHHHKTFIDRLTAQPSDPSLLNFLKSEIQADIEQAIRDQADRVKKEILTEIKKTKRK